jgi:formate/nitrite transporter FocA (FNT family)
MLVYHKQGVVEMQAKRITQGAIKQQWGVVAFNIVGTLIFLGLIYINLWEITEYVI